MAPITRTLLCSSGRKLHGCCIHACIDLLKSAVRRHHRFGCTEEMHRQPDTLPHVKWLHAVGSWQLSSDAIYSQNLTVINQLGLIFSKKKRIFLEKNMYFFFERSCTCLKEKEYFYFQEENTYNCKIKTEVYNMLSIDQYLYLLMFVAMLLWNLCLHSIVCYFIIIMT